MFDDRLKLFLYGALVLILALFIACAGAQKKEESPYERGATPTSLKVETGDGSMELSWVTNRMEDMLISGYNIYISRQPIIDPSNPNRIKRGIEPVNDIAYPGDENPEISFETYSATGLQNGVEYHVAVTTVYPDRAESPPSNVVTATPYPRGTVTLQDRMMGGELDGFSFANGDNVEYNSLANDIYFIARDIGNMIGSPDRNDGILRHTEIALIRGESTLNDRKNYKNLDYDEKSFVASEQVYMLRLSDGSMAKIRIRDVDSSQYKKQVVFDYIYFGG